MPEVTLGHIGGAFGVKGWLKVKSYTEPPEGIAEYSRWLLRLADKSECWVDIEKKQQQQGKLVVKLCGVDDREQAKKYSGAEIATPVETLPQLDAGEYYWYQLEGLRVMNQFDQCLGQVSHLLETGANDVLVVKACEGSIDRQERLIPYLPDLTVRAVDLEENLIQVEWGAEF